MNKKKVNLIKVVFASLLILAAGLPLGAQAAQPCTSCQAMLSGQVVNPAGDPAYGARVIISDGSQTLFTLTDGTGNYRITANLCLSGNYTMSISALGYTTQSVVLPLDCGTGVTNNFVLTVPAPTPHSSPTPVPTPSPACTTSCDGLVEGYIYDQSGAPQAGLTMSFNDQRSIRTTVTTAGGYYSFVTYWCPIRWHTLSVSPAGKQTQSLTLYPRNCSAERYDFYVVPVSTVFLKGDVNSDGNINIIDALMIAQYSVGIGGLNNTQAGDVNCDGNITIVDALIVAQYYVGLISVMPC